MGKEFKSTVAVSFFLLYVPFFSGCGRATSDGFDSDVQSILGVDDRQGVPPASADLGKVGQFRRFIYSRGSLHPVKGGCTAFASGFQEVTTAGHCFHKLEKHKAFLFVDGRGRIHRVLGMTYRSDAQAGDLARFYAPTVTEYFEKAEFDPAKPVSIVAYSEDRGTLSLSGAPNAVEEGDSGYILSTVDTARGASGAPVLQDGKAVAMHVGTVTRSKKQGQNANFHVLLSKVETADKRKIPGSRRNEVLAGEGAGDASPDAQEQNPNKYVLKMRYDFDNVFYLRTPTDPFDPRAVLAQGPEDCGSGTVPAQVFPLDTAQPSGARCANASEWTFSDRGAPGGQPGDYPNASLQTTAHCPAAGSSGDGWRVVAYVPQVVEQIFLSDADFEAQCVKGPEEPPAPPNPYAQLGAQSKQSFYDSYRAHPRQAVNDAVGQALNQRIAADGGLDGERLMYAYSRVTNELLRIVNKDAPPEPNLILSRLLCGTFCASVASDVEAQLAQLVSESRAMSALAYAEILFSQKADAPVKLSSEILKDALDAALRGPGLLQGALVSSDGLRRIWHKPGGASQAIADFDALEGQLVLDKMSVASDGGVTRQKRKVLVNGDVLHLNVKPAPGQIQLVVEPQGARAERIKERVEVRYVP